jgi:S-adenosylmethionine-dependent methyltransferase
LDNHLAVARTRVRLHGLGNVSIYCRNATEDLAEITTVPYQLIIFAAALEHMTYAERVASLRMAWRHLSPAGVLCIYETPNRLWFHDAHTSGLNFYHWLPDDLAIDYAKKSSRGGFNSAALTSTDLYRWGRGASFHEVDVALDGSEYDTLESLHEFLCKVHPDYSLRSESPLAKRYRSILHEIDPGLPHAFTEELLNIALRRR